MHRKSIALTLLVTAAIVLFGSPATGWADKISGPLAGMAVPAIHVYVIEGEGAGQQNRAELVSKRANQPTIYFFVPSEKWSRPTARLLRELDGKVTVAGPEAKVAFVWLTDDLSEGKAYLPRAQQSLKLENSLWTVYDGDQFGPGEWGINIDADVTIVIAREGKVVHSIGYLSPNATLTEEVIGRLMAKPE